MMKSILSVGLPGALGLVLVVLAHHVIIGKGKKEEDSKDSK